MALERLPEQMAVRKGSAAVLQVPQFSRTTMVSIAADRIQALVMPFNLDERQRGLFLDDTDQGVGKLDLAVELTSGPENGGLHRLDIAVMVQVVALYEVTMGDLQGNARAEHLFRVLGSLNEGLISQLGTSDLGPMASNDRMLV